MNAASSLPTSPASANAGPCLVRSVAVAFAEEPALEAVTLRRDDHTVSLATLGRVDTAAIERRLQGTLQAACQPAEPGGGHCQLLAGAPDCTTCETALDPAVRARLIIRQEGPRTTIARVSCPTAPRFWRWRTFALPRVVPREVELPEDEHALHEWKWQLLAAGLCGAFALAAWALSAISFFPVVRHQGLHPVMAFTLPVSAALYGYMTALSAFLHRFFSGPEWKGRPLGRLGGDSRRPGTLEAAR